LPVDPGYWRQKDVSVSVRECYTAAACLGGNDTSSQCAVSQRGAYCAVCANGFFGGGDGQLCKACEGSSSLTFAPAIAIGVAVLLLLLYVTASCIRGKDVLSGLRGAQIADSRDERFCHVGRMEEAGGEATAKRFPRTFAAGAAVMGYIAQFGVKLRILIALFQMLDGIGITFSIRYPRIYHDALRWIGSIAQVDLPQAMPIGCIFETGFMASLVLKTALPLAVMLALAFTSSMLRRCGKHDVASLCSSGWFYLLFLIYPSASSAIFQAFVCDSLEDGTPLLRVDYAVTCWEGSHVTAVIYALFMVLVYPLGTPLLYAAIIYANSDALEKIQRAESIADAQERANLQRLKSVTSSRKLKVDEESVARERRIVERRWEQLPPSLQKLTAGYEARCYWFEIFECARKILLVGLPVFLPAGSAAQLICGLLVCFISAMVYSYTSPYISSEDDQLARVGQVALFFALVSSIALKVERDSSSAALSYLLIATLAIPPMVAFLYNEDVVEMLQGKLCTSLRGRLSKCFEATVGKCLKGLLKEDIPELARGTSQGQAIVPTDSADPAKKTGYPSIIELSMSAEKSADAPASDNSGEQPTRL